MARRKTMKKGKLMSFPQLRGAFEKVNAEAKKLLVGAHPAKVTGRFQEVWKKTFGKVISPKAAMAYLSMTKKGQHGGANMPEGNMTPGNVQLGGANMTVGNVPPPPMLGAQMGGAMLSPADASWDGGLTRPGAPFPPILSPQGVMTQAYQPMPGYPGAHVPSPSFPNAASCGAMKGGRRNTRRRKQRGGAQYMPTPAEFASSFAAHPYSSMNPPGAIGDMSRIFNGQAVAPPMDVTKSMPAYQSYGSGNMSLTNMAKFDGSQWLGTMGPR
jgi:hypothetical protein